MEVKEIMIHEHRLIKFSDHLKVFFNFSWTPANTTVSMCQTLQLLLKTPYLCSVIYDQMYNLMFGVEGKKDRHT